ncbi:putative addiction module antidote [Bradyrhizobium sp. AZCC 1588]
MRFRATFEAGDWYKSGQEIVKHLLNQGRSYVIQMYNIALVWISDMRLLEQLERDRAQLKRNFPMKIEIKKIGNSDGLLIPRELMQRLDLKRGQQLHITELPGGGFQALPYDPDFERTMELAEDTMDKYRDTLATLAK